MTQRRSSRRDDRARYEIVVRGELGPRLAAAFEGMTVHATGGATHIIGEVVDQSHLHGLLERIRDFAIELISVGQICGDAPAPEPGAESTDGGPAP